jgi:hypothetical protein
MYPSKILEYCREWNKRRREWTYSPPDKTEIGYWDLERIASFLNTRQIGLTMYPRITVRRLGDESLRKVDA